MFRLESSGARWSRVVLALAFVTPLFSSDPAEGRLVETAKISASGSPEGSAVAFAQEPPSSFRTGVDLLTIDVQIFVAKGMPMPGLTSDQFDVNIAGRKRSVVFAEFLHADEGPVRRGAPPVRSDAATLAACIFGFERSSYGTNAHYRLGIEPLDTDKRGIEKPKIKIPDHSVRLGRWAWRSRGAAPAGAR